VRAIIFGAAGQDGSYLAEVIADHDVNCVLTARNGKGYEVCDVGNSNQVEVIIRAYQPDYVFHLAAKSSIRHEAIVDNQKAIVDGSLNILEAVKKHKSQCRVFLSGSALQFAPSRDAIVESSEMVNSSAYAAQRNASLCLSRYYREKCGIAAYMGFFFHHDSPRRGEHHLAQKIASAARRIASGSSEKLDIYDPSAVKEWTFAGDAMRAAWLLVNQSTIHECIIGSGAPHTIAEWASACFKVLGLDWREHVELHHTGSAEPVRFISRPERLKALGWSQEVTFNELARLMVNSPTPTVGNTPSQL
jgi:GDPmannose 4,6-dehydratase